VDAMLQANALSEGFYINHIVWLISKKALPQKRRGFLFEGKIQEEQRQQRINAELLREK
jgi:hypothetical protein